MNIRQLRRYILLVVVFSFGLTGCWDQVELSERGFVMGVAIDKAEEGNMKLTTQVYRPIQSSGNRGGQEGSAYVNIQSMDETVFEAIRDIPIHLGRRAQWSHKRIIILGEGFARDHNILDVLDFFNRDHEARLTSSVMIGQGSAEKYLEIKPLIEQTISQELKLVQQMTARNSAKTVEMNVYKLNLQLRSETGAALLPLIQVQDSPATTVSAAGVAIVDKGRMRGVLGTREAEFLLLLRNEMQDAIMKIPCMNNSDGRMESMEIIKAGTKLETSVSGDHSVEVAVSINMQGSLGEFRCSVIEDKESAEKFIRHAKAAVEQDVRNTVAKLQEMKVDVLGLGDQVYRSNPWLWKQLKEDWGERFASARFDYDISLTLRDTGMFAGKPPGS